MGQAYEAIYEVGVLDSHFYLNFYLYQNLIK